MNLRLLILALICSVQLCLGQVTLDADGPGGTYDLITSILAPGENPIEVPDCNHETFGDHIDEIFDAELNANVFRFHLHTFPDNDRCISFDRQRNEIKSYSPSPDNLLGIVGEKVVYRWKFKLPEGFQSSPNFTHLHQLKSVGGPYASSPMYTLTTRKNTPDRLELRYAEVDSQITLDRTELEPFIGTWVSVTETIVYGYEGSYEIELRRVSDDELLFSYENESIINWREDAEFVRPKWGIYRSLINHQDLRDEEVLFANFSVEELDPLSSYDTNTKKLEIVCSNPATNTLFISSKTQKINSFKLLGLNGSILLSENINGTNDLEVDISSVPSGVYVLHLKGDSLVYSKIISVL